MGQMFVSHATEDAAAAREVADSLKARGIGIWIAPDSILPGQVYNEAIVAGLKVCDALCVLVSKAANASKHVAREVGLADDLGKRIVPIRIEAVEPSDGLTYYLKLPQWVEWHRQGAAALEPVIALLGGQPRTPPSIKIGGETMEIGLDARRFIDDVVARGATATIEIRRPHMLAAVARKFAILLDDNKVGELANNNALTIRAPPGRHELTARMDYVKSAPLVIDAAAGRTHIVQIAPAGTADVGAQAAGLFGQSSYFTWTRIE